MSISAADLAGARRLQIEPGGRFVLDAPETVLAIHGRGQEIVWAAGEPFMVVGPQGVGKTTTLGQFALRRAGVLSGDFLGLPVVADLDRATLYLALDRPRQIARSLRRMVGDADREMLEQQLIVWKGPLPFDVVKHPDELLEFIERTEKEVGRSIGTVFIDSLKDVASPLSSDEVGGAMNRAIGRVIASDRELASSHHQRKGTSENRKPTSLSDVYGSTWLTAGAGSVILLWGEPGDPLVTLTHLKQPADEVGPFELDHDHAHGVTTRTEKPDAWAMLTLAGSAGTTAAEVARSVYSGEPTRAQVEKQRRRLERFVSEGFANREQPATSGESVRYVASAPNGSVTLRDPSRDPSREPHDRHETPETLVTEPHAGPTLTPTLKCVGVREGATNIKKTPLGDQLKALNDLPEDQAEARWAELEELEEVAA